MRNKHRKKTEAQAADPQLHAIGARRKVKMSNGYWVLEFWARWVLGIGLLGSVGNGYWGFKLAPIPIDWGQLTRGSVRTWNAIHASPLLDFMEKKRETNDL